MAGDNDTAVTEFFLLGLTDQPKLQVALFVVFLSIYVIALVGNLGMIILIRTDPRLHSPMYFFLSNLSFIDICSTSTITPKMLSTLCNEKIISLSGCMAQQFFYSGVVSLEAIMLAVMAYDRYVAVCNPLIYNTVMSHAVCLWLVAGSYAAGFTTAVVQVSCTFSLSFCNSNKIQHFFCDIHPLLKLSCTDIHINEIVLFTFSLVIGLPTSLQILVSYSYILSTILRIRSAEGRSKAFSTCASHLTAVTVFYGSTLFIYLHPTASYSLDSNMVLSVFYTMVIPMLNPLIYSLRNKEVKRAIRKTISKRISL
ncbi:olfactory receptor 1019-like [Mauremys mutica]|uniref:olfactory receptor 1019-like n=1 Tax=Mauremys mutica TaxID=74926 RepID=UPI001D166789|nr:olfactory receptor 1019-like [Mauremys mutica]